MATWKSENSVLTDIGVEILNKLNMGTGDSITITRIVAGSGRVSESKLHSQTNLSGKQVVMTPLDKKLLDGGSEISFYIDNSEVEFTEEFTLQQIGIFVSHPDYAMEQLYLISQCDEEGADTIPLKEDTPLRLDYSLFLSHSNSSEIVLNVDPIGMVTKQDFEAYKEEVNGRFSEVSESVSTLSGNLQKVSGEVSTLKTNVQTLTTKGTDIDNRLKSVTDNFNAFKEGATESRLLTVNSDGNLISSGKTTVAGETITLTNALKHRALILSVKGRTTQETPSITAPAPFKSTKVFDIRSKGNGKNLFNPLANPIKKTADKYGTITATPTSVTAICASGASAPYLGYIIPVTVGSSYSIFFETINSTTVCYVELDKPISEITGSESFNTIATNKTITATKPYLMICFRPTTVASNIPYGVTKMQVQLGSKTSFEEFVGSTIVLPSPIELKSIGDYYDTIEFDGSKWWKVQRIQEVVMDGTTNKVYSSSGQSSADYCRYALTKGTSYSLIADCLTTAPILSTHGNVVADTSPFYAFYYSSSKAICGHFLYSAFGLTSAQTATEKGNAINAKLAEWNTAGTPLKVRYVLNTPIVTEITPADILELFKTHTVVSTTTDVYPSTQTLGYAIDTTDETTQYILRSLARKSDVQTANTFAIATLG